MIKNPIKRGQIWKQKESNFHVVIISEKGGKYKTKTLTEKENVFGDTHTFSKFTLWRKFTLQ